MENAKWKLKATELLDKALEAWDNGNNDEASGYFDKAIETDKGFALAYLQRGAFKSSRGDYTAAILSHKEGLKCVTDDNEKGSLLFNIFLCELGLGNLDNFYKGLEQAVTEKSWNAEKLISDKYPGNKTILNWLDKHPDVAAEVKNRINEIITPHKL